MSFIPIIKQIYPDELLYSWIHRLSKTNCLLIKDFSNAYLGTENARIGTLPYDIRNEFLPLYEHILKRPDIIDFFLSTSIAGFEAMFMTEGQQTKLINNVFGLKNGLNTPSNGLIQNVNICPECTKEDVKKYGEPYLHRHHQLSGVHTCYKHHCVLQSYIGKNGHACDFNTDGYAEIQSYRNIDADNAYTDYVSCLFDADLSTNIKVLKDILYEKLKESGYTVRNTYKDLIYKIQNWQFKALINYDISQFLKIKMISAEYVSTAELIPVFMVLYPDVKELIVDIKSKPAEKWIQKYSCADCGRDYILTPYGYRNQFGCPYCNENLSEQKIIKRIFSNSGYELRSDFKSMAHHVSLFHESCGQVTSIKPRAFLFDGVRCLCETTITLKDAKKAVEASGEFEILNFTNADGICKIHAKSCAHTFDVRYRKFLKSPQCRVCFPKNMTTEYLAERIKSTTNGEYELIGKFVDQNTKIKILHHQCGQITEYRPRHYYMGASCPICNGCFAGKWEEMYGLLCGYKEEYGNANVPKRDTYKGQNLGIWCQTQRKRKNISDYQRQKLLDIGFIFDPLEAEWNRRFAQYQRYTKENGSSEISRRTDYEGEHLGVWIQTQKLRYKEGKLSEDRSFKLLKVNKQIFD